MDILSFERVWEDVDYFEIEIIAQSELVDAKIRSYTTKDAINRLASQLEIFPQKANDRYVWENGIKGNDTTPFVSLEFWCEDECGHIMIEVYMEIDDGASYSKHNCCFYIRTDVGQLNIFGKSLISLNGHGIGRKITL